MCFLPETDDGVVLDGQRISVSRVSCAYERTETRDKGSCVVSEMGKRRYTKEIRYGERGCLYVNISRCLQLLAGAERYHLRNSLLLVHPLWSGTLTAFRNQGEGRHDEGRWVEGQICVRTAFLGCRSIPASVVLFPCISLFLRAPLHFFSTLFSLFNFFF